jgi:hypothetical protein
MLLVQFHPMDGPYKEEVKESDVPQEPHSLPVPVDEPASTVMVKRNRSELTNTYEWRSQLSEQGFIAAPVSCFSHVSSTDRNMIDSMPALILADI